MTPFELSAEFARIAKNVGPKAYVSIVISSDGNPSATIHNNGLCSTADPVRVRLTKDTQFETIPAMLEAAWEKHGGEYRRKTIEAMALAIIEITAREGHCADYSLRMRFSAAEVDRYGDEAEAEANVIAGKGPFSIRRSTGSNGAPRTERAA